MHRPYCLPLPVARPIDKAYAFRATRLRAAGMSAAQTYRHHLQETEERLLADLRALRRKARAASRAETATKPLTMGQRIADRVAATMGSWRFIIVQSAVLFAWIVLNITAYVQKWDPYPFI